MLAQIKQNTYLHTNTDKIGSNIRLPKGHLIEINDNKTQVNDLVYCRTRSLKKGLYGLVSIHHITYDIDENLIPKEKEDAQKEENSE